MDTDVGWPLLSKLSEGLPSRLSVLHEIVICFGCGKQYSLSSSMACSLLKVKRSVERAIDGQISGGLKIEAQEMKSRHGFGEDRLYRVLVKEPTLWSFSEHFFGVVSRRLDFRPSQGVIVEAKRAAGYWCVAPGTAAASLMLAAVVMAASDTCPCDPDLQETGGWDPDRLSDAIGIRTAALSTCLGAISRAGLITGSEQQEMDLATVELESVVSEARRARKAYDRGYGMRPTATSTRKSLVAQQIFSGLQRCVLHTLLPATSECFTDISDHASVVETLKQAQEGKGGEHAHMFQKSCICLVAKLKDLCEVTRSEKLQWVAGTGMPHAHELPEPGDMTPGAWAHHIPL